MGLCCEQNNVFQRQNKGFLKVNNLTLEHSVSSDGLNFLLFMLAVQLSMSTDVKWLL